ncbi:MAG TPA: alpha/beta hydrolase [Ktedonobacteraceae bacterium]|nr:alpha/beta hydrolase [Ktedonobacteraceae bacterium]
MSQPLVFLHGSGDTARVWRFQLAHFGPRAYALDLPGHGQRADTFSTEVTVQDYAQAVYQIMSSDLQLERPIIVGHSLGGAIALMLALEYGSALGGLILIGTGARLRVHPVLLEEVRQNSQQAKLHLTELAVAPTHVPAFSQAMLEEQQVAAPGILYRDLSACNTFDVMSRLYEIQMPTLIICGAEDRLTPVKYSEYLHKNIAGSQLRVIDDAGHYVMREQPDAVNLAIEVWT